MNITIHRGTDQIGGCVTEYEYNGWKLFVDYGEQLPGAPKSKPLEIEELTAGDLTKSALLITHYHGDHIGCIKELPKELPIYMGKLGRDIQLTLSNHLSYVDEGQNMFIERLNAAKTFCPGRSFSICPFKVMPVTMDHSAFDAYAFKIEAGGVSVFHTGDFRTHGFRSGKVKDVMNKYVGMVDYIVCEGTNVSRPNATHATEMILQNIFETRIRKKAGHIIYMSSTNIDRLFSFYHSALKVGVPFIVDDYQKKIMDIVVNSDSIWKKSKLYQYGEYQPIVLKRDGGDYRVNDKFKEALGKRGYVLIARANKRFDKLIEQLTEEKYKYLSMWDGYLDKGNAAYNELLEKSIGDHYEYLHTSGHCDMKSLEKLFNMLQPKGIIPMHTDSPNVFESLFRDKWKIIQLHDGESFRLCY